MSFLETMINDMCNLGLESGFANGLKQVVLFTAGGVGQQIVEIMKNTTFAIGASLLTLFMLMELVTMVNRSNSSEAGLSGVRLPANVLIKFGIYSILFCKIPVILGGIEAISVEIATGISNSNFNVGVGIDINQTNTIANAIEQLDFMEKIFTYIVIIVTWLFCHLVEAIINVTAIFRTFELCLLLLFSPIPIATLPSTEFRQSAINFLKTFTAVCLQASAIIACFMIFSTLIGSNLIANLETSVDVSKFVCSALVNNIMYTCALAASVFSSGKIIKQIINAI